MRESASTSQGKEGLRGHKLKFNRSTNTRVCVRVCLNEGETREMLSEGQRVTEGAITRPPSLHTCCELVINYTLIFK